MESCNRLSMTPVQTEGREIESNDDDKSSLYTLSALYLCKKEHNQMSWKDFLQEIEMGSLNQKLNFCIQDARCQPH